MEELFSAYEEVRKSGLFDAQYYVATYPDVVDRNIDPLVHYLEEGAREGRNPYPGFNARFYLEECRLRGEEPDNPLLHFIRIGAARGFKTRRDLELREAAASERAPAAGPAGKAPVLIAIEALGVIGLSCGRSRLSVSGWALAAAPIAEITASIDNTPLGTATYGLARPDVAQLYPDRAGAAHCGFILAVDLPSLKSGAIAPLLSVRTADGEFGHHPLSLEIPPQGVRAEMVAPADQAHAGESRGGAGDPGAALMRLHIDDASVDPSGLLHLRGWVVCRVQIEAVDASIDGVRIGAAEIGRTRADIEKLHPDYPNSGFAGFVLVTDVTGFGSGRKTIAIRASARTGIAREAAAEATIPRVRETAAADPSLHYHCDEITLTTAGRLVLKGWMVCGSPARSIAVLLDGKTIGRAELGLERPDVGNLFPAFAHARQAGFAFEAETGKSVADEHEITLRVRREDGKTDEARVPVVADAERRFGYAQTVGDADLWLHIDSPYVFNGAAEMPVRGNLEIVGWALAKAGVAAIEITLDGAQIALAEHGLRRPDIKDEFPDRPDAVACGYQVLLQHRILAKGSHSVGITLRDKAGGTKNTEFAIAVEDLSATSGPWALRREMAQAEIDLNRRLLEQSGRRPLFVVMLRVNGDEASLSSADATLASLSAQAYPNWRLVIVPGRAGSKLGSIHGRLLARRPALTDRAEVCRSLAPRALAEIASRAGASESEVFFAVLSAGDELGVDAFLEMAIAAAIHAEADFFYSDERCCNPASGVVEAFFKPQWSPDLMLSTNYVGRLWCARADLLRSVTDPTELLLGHGEYDLALRCTEAANKVQHIPAVLCERSAEVSDNPKQAKQALVRMLARRSIAGDIRNGLVPGTYRVNRALTKPGLVSIIMPTGGNVGVLSTCLAGLFEGTAHHDFELIILYNTMTRPEVFPYLETLSGEPRISIIDSQGPFNFSRICNLGAAASHGEFLLFLNDDIEIVDPDWLDTMLAEAQRPEVGVVGPRLLYPDGRVQHAGVFLAAHHHGRHAFNCAAEDDPGYFGLALTQRNVTVVTGACLLTRRETFDALGGFDESHAIIYNDVDYCLRAWQEGLLNVYTPHATLIHHEGVSRAALDDDYDVPAFDNRWRDLFLAGDPYFNPHLSKDRDDFAIDEEPTKLLVGGRPTLRREEIRKILVVMLGPIGGCIIAFPAVRRLKQHFPKARISVLTSRASKPVWAFEPSIDETIELDFFKPRSADGEVERSEKDWQELRQRLSAERFDLAIDLRKHTETRPVLRHTGARWLAGFDFRNQFPWLDIALEWTGDHIIVKKRQHVADDLVNLVDAIAAACETDRAVVLPRPTGMPPALAALKRKTPSTGPLVCVHPAAGEAIKQWPIEYFAAVIDRLVEADGARIVLIGEPGDEPIAADILQRVRHPKSITSLVGKLPLAELPALLAGVALFLGNNSGPKHIAAALGVPTVGIHSGTEDVREWGPQGPTAIIIAREVVCSPCYLSRAEDCHRALACLRQLEPARVYDACKRLLLMSPRAQSVQRPAGGKAQRARSPARVGGHAVSEPARRLARADRR